MAAKRRKVSLLLGCGHMVQQVDLHPTQIRLSVLFLKVELRGGGDLGGVGVELKELYMYMKFSKSKC